MSYATIYDTSGNVISDGVQSAATCDEALTIARRQAADMGHSVIVEDRGTEECYRVTPAGHRWRAPKSWTPPAWATDDSDD